MAKGKGKGGKGGSKEGKGDKGKGDSMGKGKGDSMGKGDKKKAKRGGGGLVLSTDEEDEDEDEDDESSAPGDEQAAGGDDLAGGGQGDAHARIALEYCIDAASELWRLEKHHLEYEKILKKLGLGAPLHLNTAQCPCYAWPLCLAHTISPGASAHLISVLLLACYRQGDARGGERER